MITSFKHKGLEVFFKTGSTKGIQAIHANKLRISLRKEIKMEMFNPPHPGQVLKELYLNEYKISVTALSLMIGVSRVTASELVNGKNGVTAEMSLRLAKAFKTKPEFWLNLQQQYDLWQARLNTNLDDIEPIAL